MPISRKKACTRCRLAKARCNLTVPRCSRCSERGFRCEYNDENRSGPYTRPTDMDVSASLPLSTETIDDVQLDSTFSMPSRDLLANWDDLNFGSQLSTCLLTPETPFSGPFGIGTVDQFDQVAVSRSPENRLVKRAPSTAHEFFAIKVMLGQVESYPKMMIEGLSLPSFIHSKCALDDTGSIVCRERHTCLSEHLSICASLVQLFSTKTPTNSDFVWKTIYNEQTRIREEVRT